METDRGLYMELGIPPQSIEAEMALIGGVFIDQGSLDRALEFITAEDFYREGHRKIIKSMMQLSDRNEPCDLVTMVQDLRKQGTLEEVGGAAYLATLIDYVPTAESVVYYAKIVAEKALERRLLSQAHETIGMIQNGKSADEVMEKMESGLTGLTTQQRSEPVAAPQLVLESAKRLKERFNRKGQLQGMPWGIKGLDNVTQGIHRGQLIVIAGRPAMGKSAFAGNIMDAVCASGHSGLMFTLEMERADQTDRMVAAIGNINCENLRTGQLSQAEWGKCARAYEQIRGYKLLIDDKPGVTLREIKSKAKRQKRKGLDLLLIDYLQLMSISSKENQSVAIGEITRSLKSLARELDIGVILLSQLNRELEKRLDKRPMMSDLRASGEIEQDADVIIFPYRPTVYCQKCRDSVDDDTHNLREHLAQAEIIIEKQRMGKAHISVPVAWFGIYQRFEGVE